MKLKILIADDHAIVRFGLASLIGAYPDLEVVGQARNGEEAVRLALTTQPDVVIMDLVMPRLDGAQATAEILAKLPKTKVLLLTSFGSFEGIGKALKAGASGAVMKTTDDEEIISIIRTVAAGKTYISPEIQHELNGSQAIPELTERQLAVLDALTRGLSNPDIAKLMGISPKMARDHVSAILSKLGAANRAEAVAIALRKHLLKA